MGLIDKPNDIAPQSTMEAGTKEYSNGTYIDTEGKTDYESHSTDPDSKLFDEGIKLLPLKRYFEFDSIRTDVDREFRQIADMAKELGAKDKNGLMTLIKEAEYKVGRVEDSEERVRRIATWLKLKLQANDAFNKLSQIENANN